MTAPGASHNPGIPSFTKRKRCSFTMCWLRTLLPIHQLFCNSLILLFVFASSTRCIEDRHLHVPITMGNLDGVAAAAQVRTAHSSDVLESSPQFACHTLSASSIKLLCAPRRLQTARIWKTAEEEEKEVFAQKKLLDALQLPFCSELPLERLLSQAELNAVYTAQVSRYLQICCEIANRIHLLGPKTAKYWLRTGRWLIKKFNMLNWNILSASAYITKISKLFLPGNFKLISCAHHMGSRRGVMESLERTSRTARRRWSVCWKATATRVWITRYFNECSETTSGVRSRRSEASDTPASNAQSVCLLAFLYD